MSKSKEAPGRGYLFPVSRLLFRRLIKLNFDCLERRFIHDLSYQRTGKKENDEFQEHFIAMIT